MKAGKKAKAKSAKQAEKARAAKGASRPFRAHLVRIADREAMKWAIDVLGDVRVPYCGVADSQLLIANEHLQVLEQLGIPFEKLA